MNAKNSPGEGGGLPTVSHPERRSRWAAILAGGNGTRMRGPIRRWLGEDRPKQFCAFMGSRTMLQQTLDRAACLVDPEHILTVIRGEQHHYLAQAMDEQAAGQVIEQPEDRGTWPAALLAAARALSVDPNAVLAILPSDLFVLPEERFVQYVEQACRMAEFFGDRIVLLGAKPRRAETDYGWIEPGKSLGLWDSEGFAAEAFAVGSFHEKPGLDEAQRHFESGRLWNTMILAVKARKFWQLGWRFLPGAMGRFDTYRRVLHAVRQFGLDPDHEAVALSHLYRGIPEGDLSRDFLPRAAKWCAVIPLHDVEWCDMGHPERVRQTLVRLGIAASIPLYCLEQERGQPVLALPA